MTRSLFVQVRQQLRAGQARAALTALRDAEGPEAAALRGAALTDLGDGQGALRALAHAGGAHDLAWRTARAQSLAGDAAGARAALSGATSAEALLARAEVELRDGRLVDARAAAQAALKAARAAQDALATADAMTLLGNTLVELRDYDRARPFLDAALAAHQAAGCAPGSRECLGGQGLIAFGTGLPALAGQKLTQAVTLAAEGEALAAEARWRAHLDDVIVHLQREEWRVRELERYIEVCARLGDTTREAALWCELGNTLRRLKRAPAAIAALERALALSRAAGDEATQSVDLANLGQAQVEAGDPAAAAAHLQEALTLGPPDAPHLAVAVATLARLTAASEGSAPQT